MTAAEVRARLNAIVDPCSLAAGAPAGIDEMGLVRAVDVDATPGGAVIRIRIGLTEPGCMIGASFVTRAHECLESLPDVASVKVTLEHDCDWTPADLDAAYAKRLHAVREARRPGRRLASGPRALGPETTADN
jgi:metal-sulfur cluster biosynthetic enzyme